MKEASAVFEPTEETEGKQGETRRSALMKIATGMFAVLMADVMENNAEAKIKTDIRTDFVDTVQINKFGDDPGRIAILYRDPDGSIIDWRWYTDPKQIPRPLGDGRYMALWEDGGSPRTVLCWRVCYDRTQEDIELTERAILPAERRRKLSEK